MLENEYLELVDQLKIKFDELEEKDKLRETYLSETRKKLCVAYGTIKLLYDLMSQAEVPIVMAYLIESNKRILSEILFIDYEDYEENIIGHSP